ncbi:density-regulated protein homolog, partial [Anopheles cruzii]|uniref:density-regulated protein homolog n=1 Tax=Anopheles cruzii TaxID=68878 RepID=UPI0022EC6C94
MVKDIPDRLAAGPKEGIVYPLTVVCCGNCSMPLEYCEYYPDYEKCKKWLEKNLPAEFEQLKVDTTAAGTSDGSSGGVAKSGTSGEPSAGDNEDKKKTGQKRGGKGMMKTKKPKSEGPRTIALSRSARGKKKSVTVVVGLATFDIDLKLAAKFFGTKFAC